MKSSYALGLFYIFTVSIIWSAASILVQYLYEGLDFNSPFLLTYIGTSLFVILIPLHFIYERRRKIRNFICCCCAWSNKDGHSHDYDEHTLESPQNSTEGTPLSLSQGTSQSQDSTQLLDEHFEDNTYIIDQRLPQLQEEGNNDTTDGDGVVMSEYHYHNGSHFILSHLEHLRTAAKIAPWWFISNYFYNLSLKYTTITSSTVLASTGSIFTFTFSLIWGDETFSKSKLFGVVLAFIGSFITSLHDANSSSNRFLDGGNNDDNTDPFPYQVWGDVAGLTSAVGYGVYTVLVRILCQDEDKMSMNLFLGYVGLLNMIALSPIAWWSVVEITKDEEDPGYYNGYVSPEHLTWFVFFCLIIKGLFDNVISDFLWARSIVLTSATVATVGLGLTIPLALVSDLFVMNRDDVWTVQSVGGAILVLSGFVFVNLGEEGKDDDLEVNLYDQDEAQEIAMS